MIKTLIFGIIFTCILTRKDVRKILTELNCITFIRMDVMNMQRGGTGAGSPISAMYYLFSILSLGDK